MNILPPPPHLPTSQHCQNIKYPNFLVNAYLQYDLYRFSIKEKPSKKPLLESKTNNESIPKVLHYCWFGKTTMPEWRQKNLDNWRNFLPEFKIVRWDESNFPIHLYPYAEQAYSKGLYAFVSDAARLHAIYHYGGIYLDTNNEILKPHPFDDLLSLGCFASFEAPTQITIQTVGAIEKHPFISLLLDFYKFINLRSVYRYTANVRFISKLVRLFYKQKLDGKKLVLPDGAVILPRELLTPKIITEESRIFHHFGGTWR